MSSAAKSLCVVLGMVLVGFLQPMRAQTLSIDFAALALPESVAVDLRRAIGDEDWPQAEAMLFSLAQTGSPEAPLLEALAAAHLLCGRYLQAAIAYQRADRRQPLAPAGRLGLAQAYLRLEKRHWARRELERLAREDSKNPLYPLQLAGIFHDYQWFEMAETQARRAIALSPDDSAGHDRLGQALEGRNLIDAALEAYRVALEKDRADKRRTPWPAFHLGRLLLEIGQVKPAAAALEEALEIDPRHVNAVYELGVAWRKLDRWGEALSAFEEAASLDPEDRRVQYALSQTYRRLGRPAEAAEAARRFRALSPQ